MASRERPLHITLTTIPPRHDGLGDVFSSLFQQRAKIAGIHLFVPKNYRRSDFNQHSLPEVPNGVTLHELEFDFGPASKILPAVKYFAEQDVNLLFCDDDKSYDTHWAQRFVDAAQKYPSSAICESSLSLRTLEARAFRMNKPLKYRLKRMASFGRWKPTKNPQRGLADIFEGVGGVMVRPEFFTEDAFSIPDILWTVDDVWLSGHITKNKVEIIHNPEAPNRLPQATQNEKKFALHQLVYKDHNRYASDLACVEYYRKHHAIWQDVLL